MKARISIERRGEPLCSYVCFSGNIESGDSSVFASVAYQDNADTARLMIRTGDDVLEFVSHKRFLSGSEGCIMLNGAAFGSYDFRNLLQPLVIRSSDGRILMQVHEDDPHRRFLWAFRQGASRREARAYAQAGYALLVGEDYALASLVRPLNKPLHYSDTAVFGIMSDADERVFRARSRVEQLCILACACWWLCDVFHPAKTRHFASPLPAGIPSSDVRYNRATITPQNLEPRHQRDEFMATHPVFMWLWLVCASVFSLVILPLSQGDFLLEHVGVMVYTSLIPASWILFCHISLRNGLQRISRIEDALHSTNTCDMDHLRSPR